MSNIKGFIGFIIGLILVFGVINLIWWGGQELYYHKDTEKINGIEKILGNLESEINSLKTKIDSHKIDLDGYGNAGMIDSYNEGVDSYNSLVNEYKNKIDMYNKNVEQINALIEETGSRWYVIPIPGRRKTTGHL